MPNAQNTTTTSAKLAADDAASTRSATSFASTIGLVKDSFKKAKADKKDTKDKKPASERYTSTIINQC